MYVQVNTSVHGGQERMLGSLELELHGCELPIMGSRRKTWVPWKEQSVLLDAEPSSHPLKLLLGRALVTSMWKATNIIS